MSDKGVVVTQSLRASILRQFEPDIVPSLIEFGKALSAIDAELFVFMARKSLCLYDVLLLLGVPPIEKPLISDRCLDMDLSAIDGRRVALIDDTVIVGTTLAKTKKYLGEEHQCDVSTHVFCLDRDWAATDLLTPDLVAVELPDSRVMTFCNSEVRALSLIPRPYIVDFPISTPLRIRNREESRVFSGLCWTGYTVSTELQRYHGVGSISFFPGRKVVDDLLSELGQGWADVMNIVKVRTFFRQVEDASWFKAVPIVTLKPLTIGALERGGRRLIDRLSLASGVDLSNLAARCQRPEAWNRLVQYILSVVLGRHFLEDLARGVGTRVDLTYDEVEAGRLFGPWHQSELRGIHEIRTEELRSTAADSITIQTSALPDNVLRYGFEPLEKEVSEEREPERPETENLVRYLADTFVRLFNERELPARREARRLGLKVLTAPKTEAPNRDRLEVGIPWVSIVQHFCHQRSIEQSQGLTNLLSLALDICNDIGSSVPITCIRDEIVFRAYRHGEDARFTDSELELAFQAVSGMLDGSRREGLPHLALEKLLVLLLKVGTAKGFLEPVYGLTGTDGTARIAFDLMGAVPILRRGPSYQADRDIWLSRHLLGRGVLQLAATGYKLGEAVTGNHVTSDAPDLAYELGNILGLLFSSEQGNREAAVVPPLDGNGLVLISSLHPPRHAAAALAAELGISRRWYLDDGRALFGDLDWDSQIEVLEGLRLFLQSKATTAIHQSRLKIVNFYRGRHLALISECARYLREVRSAELLARRWEGYWRSMEEVDLQAERREFLPLFDEAASVLWELALYLTAIEIALAARGCELSGSQKELEEPLARLRRGVTKLEEYNEALRDVGVSEPRLLSKVSERLSSLVRLAHIEDVSPQLELFESKERRSVARRAFDYAVKKLREALPGVAGLEERISLRYDEYGRVVGRSDFRYLVWYDIIDSTGKLAGESGADLEAYRRRVLAYKDWVNAQLREMAFSASRKGAELHSWNGDLSSMNDEKHVFVKGKFARRLAEEIVALLMQGGGSLGDVRVRVHVVPCDFASTRAYRYGREPEVRGERFWEYLSRLRKGAKDLEPSLPPGNSILLLATKQLVSEWRTPRSLVFLDKREKLIRAEIELLELAVPVQIGRVALNPSG